AAELARVSVWIGEIQWMLKNGFPAPADPILKPLETIERRDALLTPVKATEDSRLAWKEAQWPDADVIIGNPPFLGSRKMSPDLGVEPTEAIRQLYAKRVPRGADLVCYWFGKT